LIIRILLTVIIALLSCHTVFAQEDVCDGVTTYTALPGDQYELCWERNQPNDVVDHYKVFSNPIPDTPHGEFGEEMFTILDSDCMEVNCFSGMQVVPNESGIHYLTVRAFDAYDHYSDASNDVILTITMLVLPAHSLTVEVVY